MGKKESKSEVFELYNILKERFKDFLVIIMQGSFYTTFSEDAEILSGITGYKIVKRGENIKVGFPESALEKVKEILDDRGINFVILKYSNFKNLDDDNIISIRNKDIQNLKDDEVITDYMDYKDINCYNNISKRYLGRYEKQEKISEITDALINMINDDSFDDRIKKIEEYLGELDGNY